MSYFFLRSFFLFFFFVNAIHANPHHPLPFHSKPFTTLDIALHTARHSFDYTHYRVIGSCLWNVCTGYGCYLDWTLELDEYLPDLVIAVYNQVGDNPWTEANTFLDQPSYALGHQGIQAATGFALANGNTASLPRMTQGDSLRTKSVDVIGNPLTLWHFPFLHLRLDTKAYLPYYQSDLDILGRLGIAEALRSETWNPIGNPIGRNSLVHWSHEFPRDMQVIAHNDYKAALILALRAADIVTNQNTLHTVNSTANTCGMNCSVANVIEESPDVRRESHAIWQEIYPKDRHVRIGEEDSTRLSSLGASDASEGHGNYVFVVWRHYRGCVQPSHPNAQLLEASEPIPPTQKR